MPLIYLYRDLTHTFEVLLQQREESFSQREREIGLQVAGLEKKFELLQTENSRLKSGNNECHRKIETAGDEMAVKEEQARQLQWRLDDERSSKQQSDDQTQRRVNQLTLDLTVAREKAVQDISELQRALDKVRSCTFAAFCRLKPFISPCFLTSILL